MVVRCGAFSWLDLDRATQVKFSQVPEASSRRDQFNVVDEADDLTIFKPMTPPMTKPNRSFINQRTVLMVPQIGCALAVTSDECCLCSSFLELKIGIKLAGHEVESINHSSGSQLERDSNRSLKKFLKQNTVSQNNSCLSTINSK